MEHSIKTADGRTLRVEEGGDPGGRPVLTHHGTPGAGHLYGPHEADARQRGIRLITYDRPGYFGSTAHPGYAMAGNADDVRTIAAALGIDRVAVWGISGGGPPALACAALLPDVVVAVATLASPAPYGVEGFDHFAGMAKENVEDIKLMLGDEAAARDVLVEQRKAMLAMNAQDMMGGPPGMMSPADVAARTSEMVEYLVNGFHDGLTPGGEGWWDDSMAQLRPWGFRLEEINVPVQLWHGRQDRFVPFQHGEWLATQIPGVEAHLTDEDGHTTLMQNRIPEVHEWLMRHF